MFNWHKYIVYTEINTQFLHMFYWHKYIVYTEINTQFCICVADIYILNICKYKVILFMFKYVRGMFPAIFNTYLLSTSNDEFHKHKWD